MLAEVAQKRAPREGRALLLLDSLGRLVHADKWEIEFSNGIQRVSRSLSDALHSEEEFLLEWHGESFVWRASRSSSGPFTDEDQKLIAMILNTSPWVFAVTVGETSTTDLLAQAHPLRLAQTLRALLNGASRKEIANDLEISINTVSGYARELYRRHGVHSQSALIRRFAGDHLPHIQPSL